MAAILQHVTNPATLLLLDSSHIDTSYNPLQLLNDNAFRVQTACELSCCGLLLRVVFVLPVLQVSYTASGPQFATEREEYSRFFTMQPSITLYNDAYIFLFKRFGWHRIAVIHEVDPLFTAVSLFVHILNISP